MLHLQSIHVIHQAFLRATLVAQMPPTEEMPWPQILQHQSLLGTVSNGKR